MLYEFWLRLSEPWPQNSKRALSSRTGKLPGQPRPLPCRALPGCACIPCSGQRREMPLSGGVEGEGGGLSSLETKVSSQQNQNEIGGGRGVVLKKKEAVWRQTKRIHRADGNRPSLRRCVARLEKWKAFVKLCHRNAFHLNALNSATHTKINTNTNKSSVKRTTVCSLGK